MSLGLPISASFVQNRSYSIVDCAWNQVELYLILFDLLRPHAASAQTKMDERPEGQPLSPIPSAVNPGETFGDDAAHERPPRASLHSGRARTRFGRHSLDVGRSPLSPRDSTGSPTTNVAERSNSLPTINRQEEDSSEPQQPPPIHAPTTTRTDSQRAVRSSTEFDRRFDGPFGRPSLAMTRRFSSHKEETPAAQGVEAAASNDVSVQNTAITTALGGSTPELLEPEPPPLNYTLHTRKRSIFIFWSFIIFDSVVMPIALYFGLWYGVGPGANTPTHKGEILSANAVFSIVTAAIGGASIVEYAVRFWRLWKKDSTCRVIGARRWYLDLFHWNYSLAWIIIMVELIV